MNTPSVSKTDIDPAAAAVIRLVRSRIGDRLSARSYVQAGTTCLTAAELAQRLLRHFQTPEAAAGHMADRIAAGAYRIVPKPSAPWTRTQAMALASQKRAHPRAGDAYAMLDELQRGRRVQATRYGATKASPVRDARGKIDVLATARKHGLLAEATSSEDWHAARLDGSDLATRLAFPQ